MSFTYRDREVPVVQDISLHVHPGEVCALVGPSGSGKTTIGRLVLRFWDPSSGAIKLDGHDLRTLRLADLRGAMAVVSQDPVLFSGTIRENIRYGRETASDQEIVDAAVATRVDRFVRSLPDGYDTVLDEDASNVSAGEKQLITIARAFVAQPSVLILDEATSSVDTRTELLLQHAMAALRKGRTSFVIAHRLSTIRDADLILVMEHGDIVEKGTHEELIAREGAYWRLYISQFEQAASDLDAEGVSHEGAMGDGAALEAPGAAAPEAPDGAAADAPDGAAADAAEPGRNAEQASGEPPARGA